MWYNKSHPVGKRTLNNVAEKKHLSIQDCMGLYSLKVCNLGRRFGDLVMGDYSLEGPSLGHRI